MDYYRNPHAATPGLIVRDAGLLFLRLGVALILGLYHAWQECIGGWKFFWKKEAWPLLETLTGYGLPVPQVFAVLVVLIISLCSLGLFFGVVSRLSAALLMGVAIGAILFNFFDPMTEKYWLYGIVCFVLVICGPGCFSLAYLLNRK